MDFGEKPMANEMESSLTGEGSDHSQKQEPKFPQQTAKELSLVETFNPNRQSWQLFKDQAPRLLFTFILIALYLMTFVLFENSNNVSRHSKVWYNTISTIINLALGLNFLEAFKDMAKVLRWRVLANRSFTVRETDLIMSGESLLKLGGLMWESPKKPLTLLACTIWIALNLLAQGSIALISLNASMDSGTDSTGVYLANGNVKAAKLDCFYTNGRCPALLGSQLTTANTIGQAIQGQERCLYQDDGELIGSQQSCVYFGGNGTRQGEFAYRFNEFNPSDVGGAYPHLTNRSIKASASQCFQYDIDWPNSPITSDPDGSNDVQLFKFGNSSYTAYLPIPKSQGAFTATTYVYNGTSAPQNATELTCGPRCLRMYALRLGVDINDRATAMFECQVTVSTVNNASANYQEIPDTVARIAASSIALSGRSQYFSTGTSWRQFQLYTFGNYWETGGHTAQQVGQNMAEFAIASLASMGNINPRQIVPGTLPILGYHLDLQWNYIIALTVCIGAVHFILVVLMVWIARPVFILDDSNLAVARLLYGLVGRVDGRGSLLDGKQLAAAIQASRPTGGQIVYGVSRTAGKDRMVHLDEGMELRRRLHGGVFPRGEYA